VGESKPWYVVKSIRWRVAWNGYAQRRKEQ